MHHTSHKQVTYHSRTVTFEGMTVTIETELADDGRWQLRILGRRRNFTEWIRPFSSPQEAIATALNAIHHEGIEDFYAPPELQVE